MVLSIFTLPSTAIAAQSSAMATISHNIANVNTPGSKSSVVRFRPLLTSSQGTTSEQRGKYGLEGYLRQDISRQGSPIVTGRKLDLSIVGEGFFTLQSNAGAITYTRNGNFRTLFDDSAPVTANSFLGDSSGRYLLGWSVDESFSFPTKSDATLGRILLSEDLTSEGSASSTASVRLVLPIGAAEGLSSFSHGINVIDGGGESTAIEFSYASLAGVDNAWRVRASSVSDGVERPLGSGVLRFGSDGELLEGRRLRLRGAGVAGGIDVNVDFSGVRSYGGNGQFLGYDTNGVSRGGILDYSIDGHGLVQGIFSNGEERALAQVAVADLVNPDSFIATADNGYRVSPTSGAVNYYDLLESNRARIREGQLESSTVDIAEEFSRLIETQSAYNLASLSLQTANELTQTAIGVKR